MKGQLLLCALTGSLIAWCGASAQTEPGGVNLLALAPKAAWYNNLAAIPWGTGSPQGEASMLFGVTGEDGKIYSKALFTHPQWTNAGNLYGKIAGVFNIRVPLRSPILSARVGFRQFAHGTPDWTNGVRVAVGYYDPQTQSWPLISGFEPVGYDGNFDYISVDLSRFAGQQTSLYVVVENNGDSGHDWVIWTELRVKERAGIIYGINEHWLGEREAAAISDLKLAVRRDFAWDLLEPARGAWDFSLYDRQMAVARARGIPVLGVLDYAARWSVVDFCRTRPWYTCQPKNFNDYFAYVSKVVERYQQVKYWELWNEENYEAFWHQPNAAEYARLLKGAYPIIKAKNPRAKVVLGGIGFDEPAYGLSFLQQVYQAGGKPYFDAVAIHPYRQPRSPRQSPSLKEVVEAVKQLMDRNGDQAKKIWITEVGWQTGGDNRAVSPNTQARYLRESLEDLKAIDYVEAVFWYELKDGCQNGRDFECWCGIMDFNWNKKPAYNEMKKITLP